MNPDLHPFAMLALLALLAIAVPGEIIFIVACYGVGVIVGQAFAFTVDEACSHPNEGGGLVQGPSASSPASRPSHPSSGHWAAAATPAAGRRREPSMMLGSCFHRDARRLEVLADERAGARSGR